MTTRGLGAKGDRGGRPSDLELMLYFDGELDPASRDAVEAFLDRESATRERSPTLRRKLAGLELGAKLVREQALDRVSGEGSIADSVMARLEAEGAAAQARPMAPGAAGGQRAKPANDNARTLFTLAALAVAAAAAIMIWGRTGPSVPVGGPVAEEVTPSAAPAPPAPIEPEAPAQPEITAGHGVEIAAVDFGARSGSIFYVPTDTTTSNATTTVVWLADDPAGEPE